MGITNISSIPFLDRCVYCITYDSDDIYYEVHMPKGMVHSYKGEMVLPYIDTNDLQTEVMFIQTVHEKMIDTTIKH